MAASVSDLQQLSQALESAFPHGSAVGVLSTAGLSAIVLTAGTIYVRMQIETAKLLSKIPAGASIVELYPRDAKNMFFMPQDRRGGAR
jgi:hypothetical protein